MIRSPVDFLEVVEVIRAGANKFEDSVSQSDVDQLTIKCSGSTHELDLDELQTWADYGVSVSARIARDDWTIELSFSDRTEPTVDHDGDLEISFEQQEELLSAIDHKDIESIFLLVDGATFTLTLTALNDPERTGYHWIESVEKIASQISSPDWLLFLKRMVSYCPRIVVEDLSSGYIRWDGFEVLDKLDNSSLPNSPPQLEIISIHNAPDLLLPRPEIFRQFYKNDGASAELIDAGQLINGAARAIVWLSLASQVSIIESRLTAIFSGNRVVTIPDLRPTRVAEVVDDINLYLWFAEPSPPARREAARQAAASALGNSGDFDGLAQIVLRTAKSVFEVSQKSLVAEALATRRSARQAAFSAATDAAKAAREATGKITDRSAVQLAAGAGLLIANLKDAVPNSLAVALLAAVFVIGLVSWLAAVRVDIVTAKGALSALGQDLDEYRDTLSIEDIAAIRDMETIKKANSALKAAKWISFSVALATALTTAAAAGWILARNPDPISNPPLPSPPSGLQGSTQERSTDQPAPAPPVKNKQH